LGSLGEEDVNSRVPEIRLVLLVVLDQSHDLALLLYRKRLLVVGV
jgi:hypothetical protein